MALNPPNFARVHTLIPTRHGRQIRVVLEDHQYQVPVHVKAMNKLLNLDKVFATFNVLGTPMNLATSETQFAQNVPMMIEDDV